MHAHFDVFALEGLNVIVCSHLVSQRPSKSNMDEAC